MVVAYGKRNMISKFGKKQIGQYWVCFDMDGTCWTCDREPFTNGLGRWFVKLIGNENYNDVMRKS
jgi:hypothetical protein